ELAPGAEVPFSMLSALPELFTPTRPATNDASEKALRAALAAALDDLDLMRKKEGRAIADDLSRRLGTVRELANGIAARAPDVLEIQTKKFKERLCRIAAIVSEPPAPSELSIDPARIEQEMALLLERSDISEELVRLSSHVEQMIAYMPDDEPVGRRLD